jgi:hypothetical protein
MKFCWIVLFYFVSVPIHAIGLSDDDSKQVCPRYFKMINEESAEKYPNRLLPKLNSGKIWGVQRTYPLGDILTITTGRMLSRSKKKGAIASVIGFVVGENCDPVEEKDGIYGYPYDYHLMVLTNFKTARRIILKQHPELAEINYPPELKSKAAAWEWLAELEEKYGKTLTLIQVQSP